MLNNTVSIIEGRVGAVHKGHVEVFIGDVVYKASIRGLFHEGDQASFPKVGDMVEGVLVGDHQMVIEKVLPRKNYIARVVTFDDSVQVMVTNVDYMMIVVGCDNDFNLRRLERYIALAHESNVAPLIILNKADIAKDITAMVAQVQKVASEIPVLPIVAETGVGLAALKSYLKPETVTVLMGSSGVGKSTLINSLVMKDVEVTGPVRSKDSRGKHTTTRRQMYVLQNGAMIIDTPGMRELAMENEEEAAASAYPVIDALTSKCKFTNCDHIKSAGCAIRQAVIDGEVEANDVAAYLKLRTREERHRRTRSLRR